jgi:hypothetical protein
MMKVRWSRSTSTQRSPATSPRRSPAQRGQPQRIQPVVADLLEEHGELTRGPHAHRRPFPVLSPGPHPLLGPHLGVRPARRWQLDQPGRVVADQPVPDRGVQRRPQGRSDAVQGGRCRRPAVPVAGRRQHGEHPRHLPAGQISQPDPTQMRDQMPLHMLGVGPQGGRPDPGAGRQPVPQPPRHRPGPSRALLPRRRHQLVPGCGSRSPGGVAAAADPLPPTGQRRYRTVVVPAAVPPLGQPPTGRLQPTARLGVPAPTPLEHHTSPMHDGPPGSLVDRAGQASRTGPPTTAASAGSAARRPPCRSSWPSTTCTARCTSPTSTPAW